ncbi:MAG: helix-turn-helix domain-containing protein, partial [Ketobacter sp.]
VPSLEDVAELLQVSSRTLRRNLKKQGTSYVEIVEDLRRETAISKLLNSNQSITDIAISLDFYDTSSFSKAFKRWTGQSPRAFRAAISECSSTASLAHSLC